MKNQEFDFKGFTLNGFVMLFAIVAALVISGLLLGFGIEYENAFKIVTGCVLLLAAIVAMCGFIMIEPNEARVMLFFGKYHGTFKKVGYSWVNPFYSVKKLSLRARNIDAEPIKVNDKQGNPVMIGMVLVWKLKDTYKAMFEIDAQTMASNAASVGVNVNSMMRAFENFVKIQGDAALRQMAGQYAYDNTDNKDELTLRSGGDEINEVLKSELEERLTMAGIEVVEARINYLAYAPEIAAVMLRRHKETGAACTIAVMEVPWAEASEKIVEGAVSMVKMALDKLAEGGVIELDDDKKAAMISNLMVVLCGDDTAQPVVNTGTLNM